MKRVTLKDLAKDLGLHITTVSKALSNHPKIAPETRARVTACAAKAGYTPDPYLTALSSYRASVRPANFRAVLAWFHPHPRSRQPQMDRFGGYSDYLAGAHARATALGYHLQQFWLDEEGQTTGHLARIFKARGIEGIVVSPQFQENGDLTDFPWEDFSALTIGFSLRRPQLHLVTTDHFRILLTMEQILRNSGYSRIGCYLNGRENQRMEERARGALLASHNEHPITMLDYDKASPAEFEQWFKEHRFDAIITGDRDAANWLRSCGVQIPREVAIAHYALNREETWLSGMYHNTWKVGEAAVDMLSGMLQRRERGLPEIPMRLMIEGSWISNQTT